jgi:signal transduction histidine kinase
MHLYERLSRVGFLKKSYAFKFLFVAFVGIHIPLIGILFFVVFTKHETTPMMILLVALLLTLVATAITLLVLKKLILPIELASRALIYYRTNRMVSVLPIQFKDEAGLLMRNILEMIQDNEKYLKEKQDLLYLLSHDLRTFTGNSQSLAKLILELKPQPEIKEYAELINVSTSQQLDFIQSFIKLIKDQDELLKVAPKLQLISLEAINMSVNEQVKQQLTVKNISLFSKVELTEVALLITPDLLIRVLVNLLDNAIKFSYPNSEIKLEFFQKNDRLHIAVTDVGLGFEPNTKAALFNKFTTHKKVGTANESSTGIGLYLCKTIIEKYKGQLRSHSDGVNKGATFTVVFELNQH